MDLLAAVDASVLLGAGIEAIYAGVDWLSCSLPAGSAGEGGWQMAAVHTVSEIAREGYELEAYSRNGYDGFGAGGSFFGTRNDGSYLQLSGYRAGEFLDSVSRDDLHVSRIDIQATVKYRVYAPGVGKEAYNTSVDANGALNKSRQRKIWYLSGNDGGWTTYIGSPTSEQRAKVYNKAVQSADPIYDRCWRWEITGKNEYATSWHRQVSAEAAKRPQLCARMVASWFSLRGAAPEWSAYIPLIAMPLIKEVPTDAEKRLTWLETQVAPALRWLEEHGYASEALGRLGLTATVDVPAAKLGGRGNEGNDA